LTVGCRERTLRACAAPVTHFTRRGSPCENSCRSWQLLLFCLLPGLRTQATRCRSARRTPAPSLFVPTSDPAVVQTTDVGTGHATHLGKYTFRAEERINLQTLAVTDGRYTLTAANGDTVEGTYSGQAQTTSTAGVVTYLVSGPIIGGTGRFAAATGHLTWNGGADLTAGTLFDTMTGNISAPGN